MGRKTNRRQTRKCSRKNKRTRRHKRQRGGADCPTDPSMVQDSYAMVTSCCKRPWYKFWGPEFNVTNPACLKSYDAVMSDGGADPNLKAKLSNFLTKNPDSNKVFQDFKRKGY